MESNTATSTPEPEIDNGAGSPEEFVEVRAANEKKSEATILEETNPEETSAVSIENEQNVIGEAAGKQEDEPVVDESARGTAAVSDEEIRASDVEKTKLLEEKAQLMDEIKILRNENQRLGHENQCLSNENQRLQKLQRGDTWLDGWNTQIFRCTDCNRPFGTQTRLLDHRKTWHSAGSSKIENYAQAGINSNPVGIDELKEIFQSGDLILETTKGDGSVGYVVSSQVLCMTSKVFLKMMGRDSLFKEAIDVRRANVLGFHPAVVTVDDDHQALEFILNVLHHRHDMLPKVLSFPELVRIAEICDKYELQLALKPTLDRFLEPYKTNLTGGYRDWLLISYVFGYEDIFNQISKELVLTGFWIRNQLWFFSAGLFRPSYSLSSCTPSSIIGTYYFAPTIV
jgi:predicted Ser/Thr protein kinase